MSVEALVPGAVAVVTGGASGIGLAAAIRFAKMGLKVCIADVGSQRLNAAAELIVATASVDAASIFASDTDVSDLRQVEKFEATVRERFGGVDVLMNNAGIGTKTDILGPADGWQKVLAVNLWGVINGTQVFVPRMLTRGRAGLIINTGSKQGITTPPGNPAYNVSKAGVKVFTEALQHQLRNTAGAKLSAHLLIPGFVFTGLSGAHLKEKPSAAWTPEETIEFMMARLAVGDFYILCPDNDVKREVDERRIQWAAADIIENRPPLSRWHPEYAAAFEAFLKAADDQ
jgi:NAD(P)-dependent dehydrogenase (short-subunit alcohol dehydrogenase family)